MPRRGVCAILNLSYYVNMGKKIYGQENPQTELAVQRAARPAGAGGGLCGAVPAGTVGRRHRRLPRRTVAAVRAAQRAHRLLPHAGAVRPAGPLEPRHRHLRRGVHRAGAGELLYPRPAWLGADAAGRAQSGHRRRGHGQLYAAHHQNGDDDCTAVSAGAGAGMGAGKAGRAPARKLETAGHPGAGQRGGHLCHSVHRLFQPPPHQAQGNLRLGVAEHLLQIRLSGGHHRGGVAAGEPHHSAGGLHRCRRGSVRRHLPRRRGAGTAVPGHRDDPVRELL